MDQVVRFVLYLHLYMLYAPLSTPTNPSEYLHIEDDRCWMHEGAIGSTFNSSGQCKFMNLGSVNITEPSRELFASIADGLEMLTMEGNTVECIYLPNNLKHFRFFGVTGGSTQIVIDNKGNYELEKIYWQNLPNLPMHMDRLRSLKSFECYIVDRETFDLAVLTGMMQLELINLANFVGISISDTLELPSLQSLWIHNSPIEFMNNATCKLPKLEKLYLANNSLQNIPEHFRTFANLKEFSVLFNNLGRVSLEFFVNMKNLEILTLTENKISALTVENRLELPRLRTLTLYGNKLTELDVSLWTMPALRHLSLENNQLKQVPGLLTLFTGKAPNVVVRLYENPWECPWIRETAQKMPALKPIVARCCFLSKFNWAQEHIKNKTH